MDKEVWRAAVHGVPKSWTQLSDWTELIQAYKGWFNVTWLLTQLRYRPPAHPLLSLVWYTQYPSSEKTVPGTGLLTQSSSSQYSPWPEITLPMMELLCIGHSRGALVNPAKPAANPYCTFHSSASKNAVSVPFCLMKNICRGGSATKVNNYSFFVCHCN